MRTALRKTGNSAGMIVPKAILAELGAGVGAALDIKVEKGRMIVAPAKDQPRAGWAAAAAAIGAAERDAGEWQGFANEGDDALQW